MSYEVLARRLRPTTFDDVVGQEHVTTTLRNAIESGRMPHAVLLCGPRGIGKTSIARILARGLNCNNGPTDKPCATCSACKEIAIGTSLDVQEIDAASHTGVENVREIRESVRFAASPGKHRIFIIDEVHMLSTAAFNALLKTLEEPPPRSLFIFATTDPQKMPATVLSRVQRFDLRRLSATELLDSLRKICVSEGLSIPDVVLRAVIREAEGCFRDVLTMLDRLVSGLGKEIDEDRATAVLGLIDRRQVRDVIDAVLARDAGASLLALSAALQKGTDPTRLAGALLEELRDLLVARLVEDPSALIEAPAEEARELRERAASHDPETLQRLFRVLLTRTQDLPHAPRAGYALEVAVVRLATLPDAQSLQSLLERIDSLDGSGPAPAPGSGSSGGGTSGGKSPTQSAAPAREKAPRAPMARTGDASGRSEVVRSEESPAPAAQSPVQPEAAAPEAKPTPAPEPPPIARPAPAPPPPRPHPMDMDAQRKLRLETRDHPAVQTVIDVLGAELVDIRVPR